MDHFRITVAGKAYDVVVEKIDGDESDHSSSPPPVTRAAAPAQQLSTPAPAAAPAQAAAAPGDVTSPLAGIVQAIELSAGSSVSEGDLVLTLEAMKMYTSINASASGTIKAIHVKVGDAVEEGQVIYTIG